MIRLGVKCCSAIALALTALVAAGDDLNGAPSWPDDEFHFVRMFYEGGGRWGRGGWTTDWPEAERYYATAITLPVYPSLSEEEQERTIAALRAALS